MENGRQWFKKGLTVVFGLMFGLSMGQAQANMKEMKAYKEAYPDTKPKCIDCHSVAMPKKGDGEGSLNAYGKAVVAEAKKAAAEAAEVTAETFKAVGKIEDFKGETK